MSNRAIQLLCKNLGISPQTDPNGMWHEGVLQRLRVDVRRPIPVYTGPGLGTYADGSWDTPLGIRRKGVGFGMALNHPLRDATEVEQILVYPYPSQDWYDYSGMRRYTEQYAQYAFTGGSKFPLLTEACDLMGMDRVMVNLFDMPEVMHALFEKLLDVHLKITERWLEVAPKSIDILIITDDYGASRNLLIGPLQWREFIKPRLQKIVDFGHQHGLKLMLHSDGAIRKIIPELIEMGFDILNPIEPEANGMDPVGIKKDFGDQIVLHGAASSLNLASQKPENIRKEVEHLMSEVAPGGGFVLCPSNHIMPDMPVENILELYDAAFELGRY
jgi:uroporphyrinogen decarboxylase